MGNRRQGKAGNGFTSRVWKGDGQVLLADASNTGIGFFIGGNVAHEGIFQSSDA